MKTVSYDTRNEPATGHQKRTISVLCMKLGIDAPLEEEPMTEGEAGKMIRRLERRLENKKER
jgi:hypothetical protein